MRHHSGPAAAGGLIAREAPRSEGGAGEGGGRRQGGLAMWELGTSRVLLYIVCFSLLYILVS